MTADPADGPGQPQGPTIDQHVGARLRIVRRSHGLSHTTIGRALQVPVETVRRWEDGSLRIPANYLLELSQLLSCPLTRFFDDFPLGGSVVPDDNERSEGYVKSMFDRYPSAKH